MSARDRHGQGLFEGFIVDFDSAAARDAYLVDEEHRRLGGLIVAAAAGGSTAFWSSIWRSAHERGLFPLQAVTGVTIAVIGAGLAGLTLARMLQGQAEVTIFEKSRGPGGRMAHRRRGAFDADHGAQYFTARSPAFRALIDQAMAVGAVAHWQVPIASLPQRDRPDRQSEPVSSAHPA